MAKGGADGRNDHQIACIDRLPWLVIHPGARASRPHPYSCKQPAIQGHSLARRTKPAFTGCSSIEPSLVRARRPRSRVVFVRARRPRSRVGFTPSPRPTLGGSLSSILQRLSGPLAVLRGPSWISFLGLIYNLTRLIHTDLHTKQLNINRIFNRWECYC